MKTKQNKTKQTKFVLAIGLFILLTITSCKKDTNQSQFTPINNQLTNNVERRTLNGNYNSIEFDASQGCLVFPDKETFDGALNSLEDEVKNQMMDGGIKEELINKIRTGNNFGQIKNELISNSPLSDEVVLEVINKGFPDAMLKEILYKNIVFSQQVEEAFEQANINSAIKHNIRTERRKNLSTSSPKLLNFERRFGSYVSMRKVMIEGENEFLALGNDPEDPSNPRNKVGGFDEILSTLLNQYGEVKVAEDLYIFHGDKEIIVKGAKKSIVDYVRKTKKIPINLSPLSEPENGLPKGSNPAPIDPDIVVNSNDLYNLNCGPAKVESGEVSTNRVNFTFTGENPTTTQYYWDFGDGFVSYKKNPTHEYRDNLTQHNVTLVISNEYGVTCFPLGSGSNVTSPNGTQTSTLYAYNTINLTSSFKATTTVPGDNTYEWNFSDGYSASTGLSNNITRNFPSYDTYHVVVSITHPDGTITVMSMNIVLEPYLGSGSNNNTILANNTGSGCFRIATDDSGWKHVGSDRKFKHKLELQQFYGFGSGRIHLAVNAYKKIAGLGDTYGLFKTDCGATFSGYVWQEDPSTGANCGIERTTNGGDDENNVSTFDYSLPYGFHPAVKIGSIVSSGAAFGASNTVQCIIKKQ